MSSEGFKLEVPPFVDKDFYIIYVSPRCISTYNVTTTIIPYSSTKVESEKGRKYTILLLSIKKYHVPIRKKTKEHNLTSKVSHNSYIKHK